MWQSFSATNQRAAAMAVTWLEDSAWKIQINRQSKAAARGSNNHPETSENIIVTHQEAKDSDQVLKCALKLI